MKLIIIVLLLVSIAAMAQVPTQTPEYETPVTHQATEGRCHRLMVENLYRATNPSDPQQDGYLKAAEAYRQLSQEGQRCE